MQLQQLLIETEPDEHGWHCIVVDISDDAVLHVSNSYSKPEDAERAARKWIDKNA